MGEHHSRRHFRGTRVGAGLLGLLLSASALGSSSVAGAQAPTPPPAEPPAPPPAQPAPAAPLQPVYLPAPVPTTQLSAPAQLPPGALAPATPPVLHRGARPLPPALGVTGQVEEVSDMGAVVSIGASHGLIVGSHVRFASEAQLGSEWDDAETPDVVGEVEHVADGRALVAVGLFESGALARGQRVSVTADRTSGSRIAPQRPPAMLIMEGGLRPFLPIRRVSIGAVANLAFTYLPSFPMFVRAELAPLAGRVGAGADMGAYAGSLSVGYDQRFVALGIGVGILGFREQERVASAQVDFNTRLGDVTPRLGFSQIVRVGARDGLHGLFKPTLALLDERWQLASLELAAQIPIGARFALAPRFFIAPQLGLSTGELGLRTLVHGNGSHDSLFVRPVVGFVGSFTESLNDPDWPDDGALRGASTLMYGPMVGVDLEYRL